jgi:hypothetical protein
MSKRGDDAGALFRVFWPRGDGFREFNRAAEAANAENRWPLMKSMALDKRVMPPPLSLRQKQGWLEQGAGIFPGLDWQPETHHSSVSDSSLNHVFGRIDGAASTATKVRVKR